MAIKHDISPNKNFITSKQISFKDVGGLASCSPLSPYVYLSRIASRTNAALIHKENSIPLLICPVHVFLTPQKTKSSTGC